MLDKVVVVTGSKGDLGSFLVLKLKEKGAKIVAVDLNEVENGETNFRTDLTDETAVKELINKITIVHGKIDVLINNAGFIFSAPLVNLFAKDQKQHSLDTFDKCIKANLYTTFLMGASVAEAMVRTRTKGLIINISSISAKGNAGQTAYSAAKAAIESMTKVWAKELGPMGIRSVAIAPGFIETNSTNKAIGESIAKHVKANTPLRKMGQQNDLFSTILYIVENEFLTGTVIELDGGLKI